MLKRIKLSEQILLLIVALLVLAFLDVFFVLTQKNFNPLPLRNDFVRKSEPSDEFIFVDIDEDLVAEEDEDLVADEEFFKRSKQLTTEITTVKFDTQPRTAIKLKPLPKKPKVIAEPAPAPVPSPTIDAKPAPILQIKPKQALESYDPNKNGVCAEAALNTAVNVRSIQSKLMVAALSCPGARARYNQFALKYSRPLKSNADVIINYFKCKVGQKAMLQFDKTITTMANVAAALNAKKHDDFCDDVARIFDELEEAGAENLANIAGHHIYLDDNFIEK